MQKNEKQFYSIIGKKKNKLVNLANRRTNSNTFSKFKKSRNLSQKIGNKTLTNINSYKNKMLSIINNSKENHSKNEELFSNFVNSSSSKKIIFINSVQLHANYLSKLSSSNINDKILSSTSYRKKSNGNNFSPLNKKQKKRKKIDFIKYKFLIGQRNYHQRYENEFSSLNSKKKNQHLNRTTRKFKNKDKILKKFFFDPDSVNVQPMKNIKQNISIPSIKIMKSILPKKNNLKMTNYTSIKIKKFNNSRILSGIPNTLNNHNSSAFENNIRSVKNILFEKSRETVNFKKIKEKQNITDDNCNEYLDRISSSYSKGLLSKVRKTNKKLSDKNKIENLKNRKNSSVFNGKSGENKNSRIIHRNDRICEIIYLPSKKSVKFLSKPV